ncbi:assimilatory sulfite reductase (NADPH) flavoprotein subunit [Solibacillus sp. FSL H8-0538]|uniref:assimilatory sulfite reductase (NADPH) flavoprotein subunit n=1 Tax=Solibacillus sp. FSL H8-0538 TaxID=2921400 RepID=UPI0030FB5029
MKLQVINSPFNEEQVKLLNELLPRLTEQQKIWLNGYLSAPFILEEVVQEETTVTVPTKEITVLFGSQTGNSQHLAEKFAASVASEQTNVTVSSMASFKVPNLKKLDHLFIIVSTHGEGEPPDNGISFYEYLYSKRAPKLDHVKYSVLALGDSSYEFFCKTGQDFDERLAELGATRIVPRVDCDVDFDADAQKWFEAVQQVIQTTSSTAPKEELLVEGSASTYSRKNPFHAEVLEKINLNGRGSNKETNHLELSLEGSGLTFEPGDSLAIYPENDEKLVELLLTALQFDGGTAVELDGQSISLQQALHKKLDITALSKSLLAKLSEYTNNDELKTLLENREQLKAYIYGRDLVDVVEDFGPWSWNTQQLIDSLRKIPARLYSISSSLRTYPEEVHVTIGTVAYEAHGRAREGVASGAISSRVNIGDKLAVYVQSNPNFKLPQDDATPIILICAGTGVAPFRSFLQEREERGAEGKSWLFFGDQHFVTDFLYQVEWQNWLKDGVLTNLNLAFSRDTAEKVYVQHRLQQNAAELYDWIQQGAVIYVCGDEKTMGTDVHETLITIIEQQGKQSREEAVTFVKQLQQQKRYQRDVY